MAEPTLSIGRPELLAEIGDFLGLSRTSTDWSATDLARVVSVLASGLRKFYYPRLEDDAGIHVWSFLEPVYTLATVAADKDYNLPDNFGGILGEEIAFPDGEGQTPIKVIPIGEMMRQLQSTATGTPYNAAIRPRTNDGTTGQRYELLLYPTPNAIWNLQVPYSVNPEALSASAPYPMGGPAHSETIIACCKWAADEMFNRGGDGQWKADAREALRGSILHDRKRNTPDYYQYNGEGDPGIGTARIQTVTYDGVEP